MNGAKQGRVIGFDKFPKLVGRFYGVPWAMTETKLREVEGILRSRITTGFGTDYEAMGEPTRTADSGAPFQRAGDVAVISVGGVITQRPDLFASGGTSCAEIGRSIDAALADPDITKILLHIDSPGGSVFGLEELSNKIASARQVKPVTAIADSMAASAAYWLGSQASEFVVTTGGMVGSIGVYMMRVDTSRADEKEGIKTTFIHAGKYKVEGHPELPMTDEEFAQTQSQVDSYYRVFVDHVARGRGVTPARVERDFGQGRMFLASDAVRAGMADRVATAADVVRGLMGGSAPTRGRRGRAEALTAEQELRAIAVQAVESGVAIPTSNDPATARRQLRNLMAAKVITDAERDEADRRDREQAQAQQTQPFSREAVRLAAYRAERGLPTN